jgi:hypothetical protein
MPDPATGRFQRGAAAAAVLGVIAGLFAALHFPQGGVSGMAMLIFAFLVPFCLGRFSRRHACAVAVAYAGVFAVSASLAQAVMDPRPRMLQQVPAVFTILFVIAIVPSIPVALLGALCSWLEEQMRRPLEKEPASPQSDAIQVGLRSSVDVRIATETKPSGRRTLYRRSHF